MPLTAESFGRRHLVWLAATAAALAVASSASCATGGDPKVEPQAAVGAATESEMSEATPAPVVELGLEDADYWNDPQKTSRQIGKQLKAAGFHGVVLGAPSVVELDRRQTLPVLAVQHGTVAQVWAGEYQRIGILVMVDPDRHELTATQPLRPENPDPGEVALDPSQAPQGYSTLSWVIDARAQGVAWRPSRLVFTAILRDQVSAPVITRLVPGPGAYSDEAVEELVRSEQRQSPAPAISPALRAEDSDADLPSYEAHDGTPPVPERIGLRLAADRVVTLRSGAKAAVRGSFRLPVSPRHLVTSEQRYQLVDAKGRPGPALDPQPTAVLPVHLVIVGADDPGPSVVTLGVPSFDRIDGAGGSPVATGRFNIDLLALPGAPRRAQTYFVYAYAGQENAGPAPLALVAPESLE